MADTVKIRNADPAGITYDLEGHEAVKPGDVIEVDEAVGRDLLGRPQWAPSNDAARKLAAELDKAAQKAKAEDDIPVDADDGPAAGRRRQTTTKEA